MSRATSAAIHYSVINSSIMSLAQANSEADVPEKLASVMTQLSEDFVNYNGQLVGRNQDVSNNARVKQAAQVTLKDIAQAAVNVTQYLADNNRLPSSTYHNVLVNVNQLMLATDAIAPGEITHAVAQSATVLNSDTIFANQVWPVVQQQCVQCHVAGGVAGGSGLIFNPAASLSSNLTVVKNYTALTQAKQGQSGSTLWLAKPTGDFSHVGGQIFTKNSASYLAFDSLLTSLATPAPLPPANAGNTGSSSGGVTAGMGSTGTMTGQTPTSTPASSSNSGSTSTPNTTTDPIFALFKQKIAPVLTANNCQTCHRSGGVGGGYNLVAASAANADQTNYTAVVNYLKTSSHPAYFHEKPAEGAIFHAGTKAFAAGDATSLAFAQFMKMVLPSISIPSLNSTTSMSGSSGSNSGSSTSSTSGASSSGSSSTSGTGSTGASSSGTGGSASSNSGSTGTPSSNGSTTIFSFYTQNIEPVLNSANCQSCHRTKGVGGYELLIVKTGTDSQTNFNEIVRYIQSPGNRTELHDRAAVGGVSHAGPKPFVAGDATSQKFMQFIEMVKPAIVDNSDPLANLRYLSGKELLRKITLNLASRLPTQAEYDAVANNGDVLPDAVIDSILNEDAFYDRLMEWWNDVLLTNAGNSTYSGSPTQVSRYFLESPYAFGYADDKSPYPKSRAMTSTPLQLVKYLVKNDQDFRAIVTAPYM
ncbi:MAG TPA: hypothetical protein VFM46_07845, partial [Pseudomonadales bacterium]|nr:hypothetical protein [Pseudomonadales bacterium]